MSWACVRRPANGIENFQEDSIYEKMVDFGLVPHRDPVHACGRRGSVPSVAIDRQCWLRQKRYCRVSNIQALECGVVVVLSHD